MYTCMRMIEVGSRLSGLERITESGFKIDGTLGYIRYAIHEWCLSVVYSMPMYGYTCAFHFIFEINHNIIIQANFYCCSRNNSIYSLYSSLVTINCYALRMQTIFMCTKRTIFTGSKIDRIIKKTQENFINSNNNLTLPSIDNVP